MKKNIICIVVLFLFVTTTTFSIVFEKVETAKGCSKITFNNGETTEIDVVQITANEIKYKPCGKPNDALILVSKSEVLYIKNTEGDMVYRSAKTAEAAVVEAEKNRNTTEASQRLAKIGLILSGFVFLIGPLASISGLIVSIVALNRIKNKPESYGGKTIAIWGIVLSALSLILFASLSAGALFG